MNSFEYYNVQNTNICMTKFEENINSIYSIILSHDLNMKELMTNEEYRKKYLNDKLINELIKPNSLGDDILMKIIREYPNYNNGNCDETIFLYKIKSKIILKFLEYYDPKFKNTRGDTYIIHAVKYLKFVKTFVPIFDIFIKDCDLDSNIDKKNALFYLIDSYSNYYHNDYVKNDLITKLLDLNINIDYECYDKMNKTNLFILFLTKMKYDNSKIVFKKFITKNINIEIIAENIRNIRLFINYFETNIHINKTIVSNTSKRDDKHFIEKSNDFMIIFNQIQHLLDQDKLTEILRLSLKYDILLSEHYEVILDKINDYEEYSDIEEYDNNIDTLFLLSFRYFSDPKSEIRIYEKLFNKTKKMFKIRNKYNCNTFLLLCKFCNNEQVLYRIIEDMYQEALYNFKPDENISKMFENEKDYYPLDYIVSRAFKKDNVRLYHIMLFLKLIEINDIDLQKCSNEKTRHMINEILKNKELYNQVLEEFMIIPPYTSPNFTYVGGTLYNEFKKSFDDTFNL